MTDAHSLAEQDYVKRIRKMRARRAAFVKQQLVDRWGDKPAPGWETMRDRIDWEGAQLELARRAKGRKS